MALGSLALFSATSHFMVVIWNCCRKGVEVSPVIFYDLFTGSSDTHKRIMMVRISLRIRSVLVGPSIISSLFADRPCSVRYRLL